MNGANTYHSLGVRVRQVQTLREGDVIHEVPQGRGSLPGNVLWRLERGTYCERSEKCAETLTYWHSVCTEPIRLADSRTGHRSQSWHQSSCWGGWGTLPG